MIGSKRKVLSVYHALQEKARLSPRRFDRVYVPVGLEIGALTPRKSPSALRRSSLPCGVASQTWRTSLCGTQKSIPAPAD